MKRADSRQYLSSAVPEKAAAGKPAARDRTDEQIKAIREEFEALNDALKKRSRDEMDVLYNIDTDNLSESLASMLRSMGIHIDTIADDLGEQIALFAEFKGDYDSLSEFSEEVAENYATLSMLSSVTDPVTGEVSAASIIEAVNSADASVKISAGHVSMNGGSDYTTLSEFASYVDNEYASTGMFSTIKDGQGNVTAASIVAAVNSAGSSVMIDADRIQMTGTATFLTPDDVGDSGTTEIAGNRISLNIDGTEDDGYTDVTSDNGVNFSYVYDQDGHTRDYASLNTSIDGQDSDVNSRYALNIETYRFSNERGESCDPSIKISAKGRLSQNGDFGVYMQSAYSYITIHASSAAAVRAEHSFSDLPGLAEPFIPAANDYVFCTDGIYYNGNKILST